MSGIAYIQDMSSSRRQGHSAKKTVARQVTRGLAVNVVELIFLSPANETFQRTGAMNALPGERALTSLGKDTSQEKAFFSSAQ
eukprot:4882853-Amphidinium_carterae.1